MKKIFLLLLLSIISIKIAFAELVLIPTENFEETKTLFNDPSIIINFYRDEFVIATVEKAPEQYYISLDKDPWRANLSYYLVYTGERVDKNAYISSIELRSDILYEGDFFLIVRTDETKHGQLPPSQSGMVRIFYREVELPAPSVFDPERTIEPDTLIFELFEEIDGSNITDWVQHLEDYGTRDAYHPQSVAAQEWIEERFLEMDLEVEVMNFSMPGGEASDNVIATLVGKKNPDEYVVLGGHYDSKSNVWGNAPGADDNASGTSGVMEIARILSQLEFDRSIIFCAFSGEEYGLYGSAAYASRCANQGMDILGYFNMDMIGYLEPCHPRFMTSLIYPQSAKPLADFYTDVCEVYLPDFDVIHTSLPYGYNSDHTSFNNNGYMGIFPFENVDCFSPYIHTIYDLVGPSYNSEEQAVIFTKAVLASVVTMANILMPPQDLVAIPGDEKVDLKWNEMAETDYFRIYRDDLFIDSTANAFYTDYDVENKTQYQYHITANCTESGYESQPSNKVFVTPAPPISLPLFIGFEKGAPYWVLDDGWGISSQEYYSPAYSLSESPYGNYANNRQDHATLPPIDFTGYGDATLYFQTKYDIESNSDFMYLEISTDSINWTVLDTYTGTQGDWIQKTYPLTDYVNEPYVVIRFHFYSDDDITKEGMYIDNFEITVREPYDHHYVEIPAGWSGISSNIAPAEPGIEDVMHDIIDDLIILLSMTDIYWPEKDINTIEYWDPHSGYKIKTEKDVTLVMEGYYEENKSIEISEGWNLIPVLCNYPVSCEDLFEDVPENIVIVKEVAGYGVYWPSENIYTLNELLPGKAYMLKSNDTFSLTFPECSPGKIFTRQTPLENAPWQKTDPTASSHVISVPYNVLEDFETGDFIGIFTQESLCAGYLKIVDNDPDQPLVVFANDTLTGETDGFLEDERFIFKLYESSSGEEFDLIAGFDDSFPDHELFASEGLSRLISLEIDDDPTAVAEHEYYAKIFPNPASNQVIVIVEHDLNVELIISNAAGQEFIRTDISGEERIDVSGFQKGVYFFRLKGKDFREVHRVIIM